MAALPLTLLGTPDPEDGTADDEIYTVSRKVSPVVAQKMLERNTSNRPIKPVKIDEYARDMKAGRWRRNGESIKFSHTGVLLDGQNRLHAVISSGMTVVLDVTYRLDPEAQITMDGGAKRSAADNMAMKEEKNAAYLASIAKQAVLYSSGAIDKNINIAVSSVEQW